MSTDPAQLRIVTYPHAALREPAKPVGTVTDEVVGALEAQYVAGTTDEFAAPILAEGTPQQLINNDMVRRVYLGSLFRGDEFDKSGSAGAGRPNRAVSEGVAS